MDMKEKLIARPWQPQDLIDDLQSIIDEECDNYLNTRRTTLCMARAYLEEYFATDNNVGSKWIPVTERLPNNFVSVLGYMTDAGDFPPVRECYTVGRAFFFPALGDVHPVSHWMPLPEPPKEEAQQDCTYNRNGHCTAQKMMPECDPKSCDRKNH